MYASLSEKGNSRVCEFKQRCYMSYRYAENHKELQRVRRSMPIKFLSNNRLLYFFSFSISPVEFRVLRNCEILFSRRTIGISIESYRSEKEIVDRVEKPAERFSERRHDVLEHELYVGQVLVLVVLVVREVIVHHR